MKSVFQCIQGLLQIEWGLEQEGMYLVDFEENFSIWFLYEKKDSRRC